MQIKIVCVGKTSTPFVIQGVEEYVKRLKHYQKTEIVYIPDIKNIKSLSINQRKVEEGKLILGQISNSDLVILLDEKGKNYTSIKFSEQMNQWLNRGSKQIVFIIGGAYGFSDEVYKSAQSQLSLSPMTFNHEMIRLFLVEQLYRAFTILNNEPYHHE